MRSSRFSIWMLELLGDNITRINLRLLYRNWLGHNSVRIVSPKRCHARFRKVLLVGPTLNFILPEQLLIAACTIICSYISFIPNVARIWSFNSSARAILLERRQIIFCDFSNSVNNSCGLRINLWSLCIYQVCLNLTKHPRHSKCL